MSKILIYAGTTEGRELTSLLEANGIFCDACVATEYGSQLIKASEYVNVHEGRLDAKGMKQLYKDIGCELVVDATHPYAQIATKTIIDSLEGLDIEYVRLLRPETDYETGSSHVYKTRDDCIEGLKKTSGKILLTTGSKELKAFTTGELCDRLVVRVLPGMESLKLCYDAGLEGRQIIAMQGPFSQEMNEATLKQYKIEHLVTKESGSNGGFDEKLLAAMKLGIKIHIIERPDKEENKTSGLTMKQTVERLEEFLGKTLSKEKWQVALIGIGCGSSSLLTKEAYTFLKDAKFVLGAKRMLDSVDSNAVKYPYYKKEDILPFLDKEYDKAQRSCKVAILFSGDTGFYSGATKMYEALKEDKRFDTVILPGISSVVLLAARTGLEWGSASIVSLHGKENWEASLYEKVVTDKVTYFITSGLKDLHKIGQMFEERNNIRIYTGYNLSYEDELVKSLTPKECKNLSREGLYVCAAVNSSPRKKSLVPGFKDEDFIRDKVPMTKEAVREISICKLGIKEGDTVYDIGSGTGSIAVSIASLSASIRVYALECQEDALELIKKNKEKAAVNNLEIVKATAPDGLSNLEKADCAFIGGSRGRLTEILDELYLINDSMRIVINAVSMESISEVYGVLKNYSVTNLDITQANISTARQIGDYNLMQANNPVFIFSFEFCKK